MIQVLLIIHLIVAIALILLILLQKSEGGAAGAGMSATASVSTMMQPRARPNPLSRMTTWLGIGFFATSLGLAILAKPTTTPGSMFTPQVDGPAVPSIENSVTSPAQSDTPAAPQATPGESQAPAVPPATPSVPNN